jgi:hypothetical protein
LIRLRREGMGQWRRKELREEASDRQVQRPAPHFDARTAFILSLSSNNDD